LNTLFKWDGEWYGGDYQDGKVYRLKWGHVYEGCEIMPRGFTTGVLHSAGNRVFVDAIQLFMDTGRAETPAPSLVTVSGTLPDGMVGDVVDFQYTVTGAVPGENADVAILAGALPDGLFMTDDGHVTGTIATAGTYSWTVGVANSCGILSESVQVATFGEPIAMTTLAAGDECQAYSEVITVSGGTAPYALGPVTGLPTGGTAGLAGSSITIAWPAGVTPGSYTIAFQVTDAGDGLGIFSQSVTIAADNPVLFSTYLTQQPKSTSITLNVPVGAADGQLMIAAVCTMSTDNISAMPAGWTIIKGSVGNRQALAYKIRAGDTSATFTKNAANYRHGGCLLVVDASYLQIISNAAVGDDSLPATINKGTATSKVLALVWDGERLSDTNPPQAFTYGQTTTGTWTKIGHTYYCTATTNQTFTQIQVFLADCPRAAGDVTLDLLGGQGDQDSVSLLEIEPT